MPDTFISRCFIVFVCGCLLCSNTFAQYNLSGKLPVDSNVRVGKLPNGLTYYIRKNTKPEKNSFFAPKVQSPEAVVKECFQKLGKQPSFVTGLGNKFASFIMQKLMPRKIAIKIMGDTTTKMYRLNK